MIVDNPAQYIKERLTLSAVISRYTRVEEKGRKKVCLCPFHDDHNPSLTIDDERGVYKCWSCGASGDVFSFVSFMEKEEFYPTLKRLAEECGIELKQANEKASEIKAKKEILYKIYSLLTEHFNSLLTSQKDQGSKIARDYLAKRGIEDDIINEFKIGYAPAQKDYILNFLKANNFTNEQIQHSGLYSQSGWPYFADGRIMLPVFDAQGRVIAFSARIIDSNKNSPKYINSSETLNYKKSKAIFALYQSLPALRKKEVPIICEGNFDAIALHRAGLKSAIACCGTALTGEHASVLMGGDNSSLSAEQADFLLKYNSKIYIFPDKDEPGIKASFKWIDILTSAGLKVYVMCIDNGAKDADEALSKFGGDYLKKLYKSPLAADEYIFNILKSKSDKSSIYYKKEIVDGFRFYYNSLKEDVLKSGLVDFLKSKLSLSESVILNQICDNKNKPQNQADFANKSNKKITGISFDKLKNSPFYELDLLNALILHPSLLNSQIIDNLVLSDLTNPKAKILYKYLYKYAPISNIKDLIGNTEDKDIEKYIQNTINENSKSPLSLDEAALILQSSFLQIQKAAAKRQKDKLDILSRIDSDFMILKLKEKTSEQERKRRV